MSKKIWLLAVVLLATASLAEAQQPAKVYRVGRLSGGSPDDPLSKGSFEAFRQGLHELGWIEGRNVALEPRWTGERPESLRDLAAELVRLRVDVIVANGSPMIRAAKRQRPLSPSSWRRLEPIQWRRVSPPASPGPEGTSLD